MTFATLHIALWPQPGFSANKKGAYTLCLDVSFVYFVCVTKIRTIAICHAGIERKINPCKGRVKCFFLSKIQLNVTYHVFKRR